MANIDWYFDFISPFAYLQFKRLPELKQHKITLRPVLFAGLLNHWEHKGPAEIPLKRQFTYRYVTWYAKTIGVPLRVPPAHPFNPLPALRLAIASGATHQSVGAIFDFVWARGEVPQPCGAWNTLCEQVGVTAPAQALAEDSVKRRLRINTEQACAVGVFGVPTAIVNGELFWGVDATDMLLDYLNEPQAFFCGEMHRVSNLPTAASRL
ncbi:MAG: 2-hydroxychromene-2-carboxylate isomerase [Gammaproteobacteria bacterium]|nr:2-hydroxychromene-2-carboxylate isomerase [Gammaproteobacteria bacterium]